jgi:2-oxoglutarate dehydrogenase E2 component (dihydrolipoamide succinyltransferase)
MSIELKVPEVGESVTEVEIGEWLKAAGQTVRKDEPLVTLESEKATVELAAPEAGVVGRVLKEKGATAKVGEVIGYLEKSGTVQPSAEKPKPEPAPSRAPVQPAAKPTDQPRIMPAAQLALAEHHLRAEEVQPTGPGGRILKEDVLRVAAQPSQPGPAPAVSSPGQASPAPEPAASIAGREQEVVPMSRLRRTLADRLVSAQHNAALLTTFNEVDMGQVMALRKEHGEAFQQNYQVKLGFMSFFVKACIDGLKQYPALNAEIRDQSIVYHNYFDVGVAVGSGKGLVVPVLRNAERMSFAQIEVAIGDFARRAKENKLKLEELQGGTFTISNGGVYGSLLSTPIVNPPQSGVLGLHGIQDRPVARAGNVVIRPMMYIALTYDHRVVDGREAVSFLKRVKDVMENPARMLLEI